MLLEIFKRIPDHRQKQAQQFDVTFIRLSQSDAQLRSNGAFLRDALEDELDTRGLNKPNKLYAVYYGGSSTFACGGAPWPPDLVGNVVALYLKGTPPGAPACSTNSFATNENTTGYWEFSMVHEIVHALGFVATCAPNETLQGHVSDSPTDLMYAGSQPWQPSVIDIGRDDYFTHGNPGCPDLAQSVFVRPATFDATVPPGW